MVLITHIHMTPPNSSHQHITEVRWRNPNDGKTGQSSIADMLSWIEDRAGKAQVSDGRRTVDVGVVDASPRYLRTFADGVWTDNLLALPRY